MDTTVHFNRLDGTCCTMAPMSITVCMIYYVCPDPADFLFTYVLKGDFKELLHHPITECSIEAKTS
jgi:hypothetical protein